MFPNCSRRGGGSPILRPASLRFDYAGRLRSAGPVPRVGKCVHLENSAYIISNAHAAVLRRSAAENDAAVR